MQNPKERSSARGHTDSTTKGWNVAWAYMTSMSVPYSRDWLQNLHSVPAHLAVATGHLFSPLLFFPAQVTYPGRIRPRLCTLHSFLTSFLFSMPGGSWTVSSLACKCICASGIHRSMSVWMCFSSFLLSFLFPCCLKACPSLLTRGAIGDWSSSCQIFLNGGKNGVYSIFSFLFFFPPAPPPPFWDSLYLRSRHIVRNFLKIRQSISYWVQRSTAFNRILELTKASALLLRNNNYSFCFLLHPLLSFILKTAYIYYPSFLKVRRLA